MDKKKYDIYNNIYYASFPVTEKSPILAGLSSENGVTFPSGFDMHFALEFGIVLSGKIRHIYKNWETELDAGKVWFCGIWEPHGWEILVPPIKGLQFKIWPPMLFNLRFPEVPEFNWMSPFTAPPDQRPRVLPGGAKRLNKLYGRFKEILSYSVPEQALLLRFQLLEILFSIQRSWEAPFLSASAGDILADYYVNIAKAVEMSFSTREFISEKEAAAECGMSRNSFNKKFKDLMGITFSEFARSYRLSNAADEILETNASIKSVALNWGFTDTSHFLKCFRNHYMCTPLEYRKRHSLKLAG